MYLLLCLRKFSARNCPLSLTANKPLREVYLLPFRILPLFQAHLPPVLLQRRVFFLRTECRLQNRDAELFGNLSAKYKAEKEELQADIQKLVQKENRIDILSKKAVILRTRVHKLDIISELTPEVLRDLVERIEVGEKSTAFKKLDKNRKSKVLIYGVGWFLLEEIFVP